MQELLTLTDYFRMHTAAFLKHPRNSTGVTSMDYQSADSENLMKRIRTGPSEEVEELVSFSSPIFMLLSETSYAWPSCGGIIFIVLLFLLMKSMCLPMVSVGFLF